MKINTVAILGAGAIGSYFIYGFSAAPEIDFCLIAKGERKERLERDGLCINDKIYKPKVKTPEEARGVDLLLVSTKYNGLRDALEDIRTVVGPHTTVLSLLNGIDSEEIIGTVIDPARIAYSLMRINSERKGNSVTFNAEKTPGLFVGEKDSREETERLLAIRELLAKTPLRYHFCEDIISEQWLKFTLNIAYNLPQAVLGTGYAICPRQYWARDTLLISTAGMWAISGTGWKRKPARWRQPTAFPTGRWKIPAPAGWKEPVSPRCRTWKPNGIRKSTCSARC